MAFLQEELRNYTFKAMNGILSTGSRSTAPDNLAYYEEMTTGNIPVMPTQIYSEINLVPPAPTRTDASTNASNLPTIIKDFDTSNAIHLTPSPNNKAFFCTETFGDLSTRFGNFIMPQMIPRTDAGNIGRASIGYTAKLYQGDPNSGGTEILTTTEQSGANVGWLFNYGAGAIIIASSFSAITNANDVWLTGFQYIGKTGGTTNALDAYATQFTESDLNSGYLTVTHNLNALFKVCNVTIMDNNNQRIDPDGIVFNDNNTLTIDMRMLDPLTGTWAVVVNTFASDSTLPPAQSVQPTYINGPYINGNQIN